MTTVDARDLDLADSTGEPRDGDGGRVRDVGSQTVFRALSLLRCFSPDASDRSLTELSEMAGLTVSTTHRLLRTLTRRRYLIVDTRTKRYSLGPAVLQLAGAIYGRGSLLVEVPPFLETLRRVSGESCGLHALVDEHRVCLIELESHLPIRMSSGIGRRYPLHRGAAGLAIMAHLPQQEIDGYLVRHQLDSEQSREELLRDLQLCRERGFATSHGAVLAGATAVAVPIVDVSGYPVAAINVTGPDDRWTLSRAEQFGPQLVETVESLVEHLGVVTDL